MFSLGRVKRCNAGGRRPQACAGSQSLIGCHPAQGTRPFSQTMESSELWGADKSKLPLLGPGFGKGQGSAGIDEPPAVIPIPVRWTTYVVRSCRPHAQCSPALRRAASCAVRTHAPLEPQQRQKTPKTQPCRTCGIASRRVSEASAQMAWPENGQATKRKRED